MSFIVNVDGIKDKYYKPIPEGIHTVKVVYAIEIGHQIKDNGISKYPYVVVVMVNKSGQIISSMMPMMLFKKALFYRFLTAIYGDLKNLKGNIDVGQKIKDGLFLTIKVKHSPNGSAFVEDFIYVAPENSKFDTKYPVISLDIQEAINNPDKIPFEWIRKKLENSVEWRKAKSEKIVMKKSPEQIPPPDEGNTDVIDYSKGSESEEPVEDKLPNDEEEDGDWLKEAGLTPEEIQEIKGNK